ncbi:MAG: transglycosylase SLT domain-containing protein, partial [Sterolibacterium sp.]|nr:transglycosylase SLT domain-containing protein [Sterolibacterium sp.]
MATSITVSDAPSTATPATLPAPGTSSTSPAITDTRSTNFPLPLTKPQFDTPLTGMSGTNRISGNSPVLVEVHDDIPRLNGIDLITPPDDLWQRVRNGFSMPNIDSPMVADRQAWYLNRPELLKSVLNRSRRYLFHIVGELEKRGMPTELALLPMVESSYNPMAYSPARASGLWQFIPSTGKNYRLQQDWWQDQRRDVIASTGAALSYLQNIYDMHGDWHLALASYNWGEAAVARAIAKNQARHLPTDYLSIHMPAETRQYVPKLQALKNIIANPKLFGIKIDPIPNQPYFDTVGKTVSMDIDVAARLAEVPLNEFLALNPSYNRPVMPGGTGSPIILPADKVQTFLTNLERHEADEKPLSNWTTYTLKRGERLDKVAARYGMSLARLKQINSIGPRVHIHAGNRLLVPGKNLQLAEEDLSAADLPQEAPFAAKSSRYGARKHTTRASSAEKRAATK